MAAKRLLWRGREGSARGGLAGGSGRRARDAWCRRDYRGEGLKLGGGRVAAGGSTMSDATRELEALDIDKENFAPFGQVISPTGDGKHFDETDAQLVLDKGIPRFYIMRLERRGMAFGRIVHHAKVTQCLGSTQGQPWYMAVAKSDVETPSEENMQAFRIPPGVYIKLHCGTWHAGPLFDTPDQLDFANLELSDTNEVDFNCFDFEEEYSIKA